MWIEVYFRGRRRRYHRLRWREGQRKRGRYLGKI